MFHRINSLFPMWAILASTVAVVIPEGFSGAKSFIGPLLMVIMFCMGLTLTPGDFAQVIKAPKNIALGLLLQFLIMPLAAWLIAMMLKLPTEMMTGLVLVGASAGGTASNVITYLAGGKVALSISLTLASTATAIVATPWLTALYLGQTLDVPILAMMQSIASIVVLPVALGLTVNHFFAPKLEGHDDILAFLAMACIVVVIAIIVALNQPHIMTVGPAVAGAVVAHNLIGLSAGYGGAKLLGCSQMEARTIAIEVGMQNSGLAAVLAAKHFGVAAALPGALFSIWHNISGSIIASYWRRTPKSTRN